MKDPILEEVRKIKRQIALEYRRDPIAAAERCRLEVLEARKYLEQLAPEEKYCERRELRKWLKELAVWKRERKGN
jgi:hypothetical protein